MQISGYLPKYKKTVFALILSVLLLWCCKAAQAQPLPLEQKNTITKNWLVYQSESAELLPYISKVHSGYNALHQWVAITDAQPFLVDFTAPKDLCLLLNNKLFFKADSTAVYTLDLKKYSEGIKPVKGNYLLTVWHPDQQPDVASFKNHITEIYDITPQSKRPFAVKFREYVNQNAFILFILLIGLIYGWLRSNFPADFAGIFNLGTLHDRAGSMQQAPLIKPIGSWSGVLFILAFSLSIALVIAAIHTNVQHVRLFNRLFPVSEADLTTKIIFYTFLVFGFILFKYLFLKVMGFIFGLEQVVDLQYREFLRSILFLGMFLPVVMLLYLALNAAMPQTILLISNLAVSLLLVLAILRVFFVVNTKAPILNLHLFSYLCATEVIPLAIMLKLIVFNF